MKQKTRKYSQPRPIGVRIPVGVSVNGVPSSVMVPMNYPYIVSILRLSLQQIAFHPRNTLARRNARSTLAFLDSLI